MSGGVIFIDLNNSPSGKFNTCKHRSENKINKSVNLCCGRKTTELGFECIKRNIFPLNGPTCEHCGDYENKEV